MRPAEGLPLRDQTRCSVDDFAEELGIHVPGITKMRIPLVDDVVGESLERIMLVSKKRHFQGAEALAHIAWKPPMACPHFCRGKIGGDVAKIQQGTVSVVGTLDVHTLLTGNRTWPVANLPLPNFRIGMCVYAHAVRQHTGIGVINDHTFQSRERS